MADPVYRSAVPVAVVELDGVSVTDESSVGKWRLWQDLAGVGMGHSVRRGEALVFCVSPGEWLILGPRPDGVESIDISHVRAAIRATGPSARQLLERHCALDLSDPMTPNGAAARTKLAGMAIELVRDDVGGVRSYLLLVSRSFAKALHHTLTG